MGKRFGHKILALLVGLLLTAETSPAALAAENGGAVNGKLILHTRVGRGLVVSDFTKVDQPSWAGPWGYAVAGTATSSFLITYVAEDKAGHPGEFLIALNSQPLGSARRDAEAALIGKLGVSKADLCELVVHVRSAPGLSARYDGADLGLSYCPGAVSLPLGPNAPRGTPGPRLTAGAEAPRPKPSHKSAPSRAAKSAH